jgi:hypothetical protein
MKHLICIGLFRWEEGAPTVRVGPQFIFPVWVPLAVTVFFAAVVVLK